MDKYEYSLKLDQIKSLSVEGKHAEAAEIADTINWNKIKNVNALVKAGEVYENVGRYEDSSTAEREQSFIPLQSQSSKSSAFRTSSIFLTRLCAILEPI